MLGGFRILCWSCSSISSWRGLPSTLPPFRLQRRQSIIICSREEERDDRIRIAKGIRKSSPQLIELEYAHLNLTDGQVGHVRIRQHVNPLSSSFSDCSLPLTVDIGCGSGRFLLSLAKRFSESQNYLGIEIRQKLVHRSQVWTEDLALKNIHFMFANATISFEPLMSTYPGPLKMVSILCPDPHFKKKYHKRRILQKLLVDSISKNLCLGGQVFLQSDVLEVALDMRSQFDALSDVFGHISTKFLCDPDGWLLHNPMGIRTEERFMPS